MNQQRKVEIHAILSCVLCQWLSLHSSGRNVDKWWYTIWMLNWHASLEWHITWLEWLSSTMKVGAYQDKHYDISFDHNNISLVLSSCCCDVFQPYIQDLFMILIITKPESLVMLFFICRNGFNNFCLQTNSHTLGWIRLFFFLNKLLSYISLFIRQVFCFIK